MTAVFASRLLVVLAASCAASCSVRQATQVFVVVVPDGFETVGVDAGPAAEVLGTIVVEARTYGTLPPCASRDSAATSVAAAVDALHTTRSGAHTVGVTPEDEAGPLWITVWGKVLGRDRARRSFLVRPERGRARVLCVGLAPSADDCQCANGAELIALDDASGVEAATAACEALVRARGIERGVSEPSSCAALTVETCGLSGDDAGSSLACSAPDASTLDAGDAARDAGDAATLDAGDAARDAGDAGENG